LASEIILSPEAMDHLAALSARHRRVVLDAIEVHLSHQPTTATKQRKPLRPNPLAPWELRVGTFRVDSQVESDDDAEIVYVIAVGRKVRNRVIIAGVEVKL